MRRLFKPRPSHSIHQSVNTKFLRFQKRGLPVLNWLGETPFPKGGCRTVQLWLKKLIFPTVRNLKKSTYQSKTKVVMTFWFIIIGRVAKVYGLQEQISKSTLNNRKVIGFGNGEYILLIFYGFTFFSKLLKTCKQSLQSLSRPTIANNKSGAWRQHQCYNGKCRLRPGIRVICFISGEVRGGGNSNPRFHFFMDINPLWVN